MNSRYPNLRQAWLRRLAALVVVAMLASMLPVSVLAEENYEPSWSTSQPDGADNTSAPGSFTYEGLDFEFDNNPDVAYVNKTSADDGYYDDTPEYYDDQPSQAPAPSEQYAPQEDGENAPENSEENASQEQPPVDDGSVVITGFADLEQTTYSLPQKLDLQSLAERFPETLEATIEGMEDQVSFKVAWYCEDYEDGDFGTYIFDPRFVDEVVVIGDREIAIGDVFLDLDVELPRIVVSVAVVTGFQEVEEGGRTLMEKPETAEQAAQALGLPDTIYGTLSDSDELQAFPVRWVCDEYEGDEVLSFTFRAVFADVGYALAEGVSMPAIQAKVAPVAAFEALAQTEYYVDQVPGSVEEAVALMDLPETINGLPAGFVEDTSYQITWDSPDFEANEYGEYTFVASFAGVQYALESGVEMPRVIMIPAVFMKAAGDEVVSGDYTYTYDAEGNATIKAYSGTDTEVVVPDTLDGYSVTAIGDSAFANNTTITSVALPAGLTTIGASAFAGCTALTKVTLPDSVESVDETAFTGDTKIDTVILSVSGKNTALTALDTLKKGEMPPVKLPLNVTDIEVLSGEELVMMLDCDFDVAKGHHITVEAGSILSLPEGKTINNHGTIEAKAEGEAVGRITNEGNIYSCDVHSTVSGEIEAPAVLHHAFSQEGTKLTCAHCGQTVALKSEPATRAKLNKDFDWDNSNDLGTSDFEAADSTGEAVALSSVTATYEDEKVGTNKRLTAKFKLTGSNEVYTLALLGAIKAVSISDEKLVTLKKISDQVYDGSEQEPRVEMTYLGQSIDKSEYSVVYYDNENVGTASVIIIANENGNFTGVRETEFTIKPRPLSDVDIASIDPQQYTGKAIEPEVFAEYNGYPLVEDDDYTVVYSNNIEVGIDTAKATLTGKGNFTGTRTVKFTIREGTKTEKTLKVRYKGSKPSKTYDGTRNVSLKRSDFEFVDQPETGDTVEITRLNASYDSIHAGERNVNVSFSTKQDEQNKFIYKLELDKTLTGTIDKRDLTITPISSKVYGQTTTYTYRGLLSVDTLRGDLTVSPDENVGTRTVSAENLRTYHDGTAHNDYNIILSSNTITISAKPINASDIAVTLVGNSNDQTYTGNPINPVSSIRYNVTSTSFTTLVEGMDYEISYSPADHTNVTSGTITATIRGKGNFTGERTVNFKIVAKKISEEDIKVSAISNQNYTGSAITPTPEITYGGKKLTKDTDYTLSYKDDNINPGTATITIAGKGNFTGERTATFKIVKNINHRDIKVSSISDQTHTGSEIKPTPTITDGSKTLTKDTDYTLTYRNNTKVGTATITITGIGNYTGTRPVEFKIKSSGSSSGSSSSSSSDDDDDEETTVTEEAHYGYESGEESSKRYLSIDTVNQTAEYYSEEDDEYLIGDFTGNLGNGITVKFGDSDKSAYITLAAEGNYEVVSVQMDGETWQMNRSDWAGVDAIIAEHRNPHIGELKVDGEYRGVVLFDEGYQPKPFTQEVQDIEDAPNQRRVVIRPLPERDASNDTIYLDVDQTRARFAPLHLRMSNNLIETLKQLNVAELVIEYDQARLRVPLEALTSEIDLNKLYEPEAEATTEDEAEGDSADEASVTEDTEETDSADEASVTEDTEEEETESPEGEPVSDDSAEADEEFDELPGNGLGNAAHGIQENEGIEEIAQDEKTPMAGEDDVPVLQRVDMYDIHIEQVYGTQTSPREAEALNEKQVLIPMYRLEVNALAGTIPVEAAYTTEDITNLGGILGSTAMIKLSASDTTGSGNASVSYEFTGAENFSLGASAGGDEARAFLIKTPWYQTNGGFSTGHGGDHGGEYKPIDTDADWEDKPTPDDIAKKLNYVGDIGVTAIDPETGWVYFSLNVLSSSAELATPEQVIADGVYGGGVVEIYGNREKSLTREIELGGNDTIFTEAHRTIGDFCEVRLSRRLSYAEELKIFKAIEQVIDSNKVESVEKSILYTLPRSFPVLRLLNHVEVEDDSNASLDADAQGDSEEEPVGNVEFSIKPIGPMNALPVDAKELFVAGDENVLPEKAVVFSDPEFRIETYVDDNCAVIYPEAAGMYGIVQSVVATENAETVPSEQPVETAEPVAEATPAPTPVPTPTPAPVPADDPEPMYAYNRRSNEGNMYWLVNNQEKTVEFYREDTKTYKIGDYTGSLIGGMTVQYRDSGEMGQIKLKFQQTYKFALTDVDGSELLMEQCGIDDVESIMKGVR